MKIGKRIYINIFFFSCIIFSNFESSIELSKYTACDKVPDSSKLQYRFGNGLGYIGGGYWDDARMSNLSRKAGYDTQRKKLPEKHFDTWGYEIELGDAQTNTKLGILDVVGYLATPTKAHSSNATGDSELCYPANLYEPIFLSDGSVNPNNYWAYYVNKTVSIYKDHIKIWETWNEPDYTKEYGQVANWTKEPPNPKILPHWYGSIFSYIRLLRITYEVAKKADPTCFVATGGLGYPEFLHAILRYTDEPNKGEVTIEYPYKGGAYFDCDAYHQYPQYGVTDIETGEKYNDNGSDMLAKKVVILKKNHEYILKQFGFDGIRYPEKLFINTETGLNSEKSSGSIGGDLVRRNWILKLALYSIKYDVRQTHMLILQDGGGGMGDFTNIKETKTIEEGFTRLKSSSKGRLVLQKIHIGKFVYNSGKTQEFLKTLPQNTTGMVLKRKFPKEDGEQYYYDYIYSAWINCEKEEVGGEIEYKYNMKADSIMFDWEGKEKHIKQGETIKLTSTPIFLLLNEAFLLKYEIYLILLVLLTIF